MDVDGSLCFWVLGVCYSERATRQGGELQVRWKACTDEAWKRGDRCYNELYQHFQSKRHAWCRSCGEEGDGSWT